MFIRIPDPDFYDYPSPIPGPVSWIPDPKIAKKGEREKNCCPTFFGAKNSPKLKLI
jgi:hypothetical protein